MRVGIIIQARMGSTRLPGKTLLPLAGKTVLEHVVSRMGQVSNAQEVVVATTVLPEDEPILRFCRDHKILYWRGSSENVLERYIGAAEQYKIDGIVRITADCPLIDTGLVEEAIKLFHESKADVVSNIIERTLPRGFDTEIFTLEAAKRLMNLHLDSFYYEHVTPYFYEHPEIFKLQSITAPPSLNRPDLRLCLDVSEDYELLKNIFQHLPKNGGASEIMRLFDQFPDWQHINENVHHLKRGGKT